MLELRNLTVGYDGHAVLNPVDLSLSGGIAVLIGANGCGKSTLLRTIAGTQQPVGGHVVVDGCDMHATPLRRTARMVSMVFTDRTTAGDLTVGEVAALGRTPYTNVFGRLGADGRAIVADALRAVGIEGMSGRKLATLSDGERQKAMIARALAQSTPLIIMDEPTSFLDAASRIDIMLLLRRLRDDHGKTIILSTHDIAPALAVADTLWVVERTTRALVHGSRNEVLASGVMDRVFLSQAVTFDPAALDYRPR